MTSRGRRAAAVQPERGSATVLLLAVMAVALTIALCAVALARAAHARGHAQTAADLAAIAAADAAQQPGGAPCLLAAAVARADGAQLTACAVQPGGYVEVSTAVAVSPLLGWSAVATAQARAGPVR